jgi:hypothetical protein
VKTDVPVVETFMLYENANGQIVSGVPWADLAQARREAKAKKPQLPAEPPAEDEDD